MSRVKSLLVIVVGLVFGAGFIVGMFSREAVLAFGSSETAPPPREKPNMTSFLSRMLGLTPQQRQQMTAIWADALAKAGPPPNQEMDALHREREDAIDKLLTPQQQMEYDQIQGEFRRQMDQLHQRGRAAFREAVEKTKGILDADQRIKYEEFLTSHENRDRSRPHGPPPFPVQTQPTSPAPHS